MKKGFKDMVRTFAADKSFFRFFFAGYCKDVFAADFRLD
jgi:hypothetical protein